MTQDKEQLKSTVTFKVTFEEARILKEIAKRLNTNKSTLLRTYIHALNKSTNE